MLESPKSPCQTYLNSRAVEASEAVIPETSKLLAPATEALEVPENPKSRQPPAFVHGKGLGRAGAGRVHLEILVDYDYDKL